jgi:cAMP-dependent protein kinase regulator
MEMRRQLLDTGEQLRTTTLFRDLSVAEATVLGTFMERRVHQRGDLVVRQGDPGDALFLIESGEAEVRVAGSRGQSTQVATLGPGDFFGEIALVTGGERSANVMALSQLTVMYLSAEAYGRYLERGSDVGQQVTQAAVSRMRDTAQRVPRGDVDLPDVPELFRLSAMDASVLGTFMERLEVPEDTVIVRQSDPGDTLYLIAAGEAEVRVTNMSGASTPVARLGPGDYFGEIALVTGGARIADVVALTPMTLARLNREGYERFTAHTATIQQLAMTAATRASATARKLFSER